MVLNCPDSYYDVLKPCVSVDGCCSNQAVQDIAIEYLCPDYRPDDLLLARAQQDMNKKIALCRFDGFTVADVKLQLTPNATAILNDLNRPSEKGRVFQGTFLTMQILGGHIGLPIFLLFSIFSKGLQRNLTLLNFCFTWILSSIAFSIGLYRLGPVLPEIGLFLPFIHSHQECLVQAALITGAQVMTDASVCALIVEVWFYFRGAIHGRHGHRKNLWARAALLALPYAFLLAFSLPALSAVTRKSFTSRRFSPQNNFYCVLGGSDILRIQHIFIDCAN
ncbi:hypothetical protein JB92DRAFT_2982489 [Gautieria morchelliformis]|nr:hypothetical protein JB92DRAFT_2982489 [Gautieria morchelliformis]